MKDYWLPVLGSDRLGRQPVGVVVMDNPLVVFRAANGQLGALDDRCPHRNVPLSEGSVVSELLVCKYHGWSFDREGHCRKIPGRCGGDCSDRHSVKSYPVRRQDGLIWVALDGLGKELYRPAHLEAFHTFVWSGEMIGSMVNVAENFLDGTHTHFVHAGLIRSESGRSRVRATVVCEEDRIEARYSGEQVSGWWGRLMEGQRESSCGRFIYPCVAEIETRSKRGVEFAMTTYLIPSSEGRLMVHALISTPRRWLPAAVKQRLLRPFIEKAYRQDRDIVRLQTQNIERFGGERYVSTEADLVRSHILTLLSRGRFEETLEREVLLEL